MHTFIPFKFVLKGRIETVPLIRVDFTESGLEYTVNSEPITDNANLNGLSPLFYWNTFSGAQFAPDELCGFIKDDLERIADVFQDYYDDPGQEKALREDILNLGWRYGFASWEAWKLIDPKSGGHFERKASEHFGRESRRMWLQLAHPSWNKRNQVWLIRKGDIHEAGHCIRQMLNPDIYDSRADVMQEMDAILLQEALGYKVNYDTYEKVPNGYDTNGNEIYLIIKAKPDKYENAQKSLMQLRKNQWAALSFSEQWKSLAVESYCSDLSNLNFSYMTEKIRRTIRSVKKSKGTVPIYGLDIMPGEAPKFCAGDIFDAIEFMRESETREVETDIDDMNISRWIEERYSRFSTNIGKIGAIAAPRLWSLKGLEFIMEDYDADGTDLDIEEVFSRCLPYFNLDINNRCSCWAFAFDSAERVFLRERSSYPAGFIEQVLESATNANSALLHLNAFIQKGEIYGTRTKNSDHSYTEEGASFMSSKKKTEFEHYICSVNNGRIVAEGYFWFDENKDLQCMVEYEDHEQLISTRERNYKSQNPNLVQKLQDSRKGADQILESYRFFDWTELQQTDPGSALKNQKIVIHHPESDELYLFTCEAWENRARLDGKYIRHEKGMVRFQGRRYKQVSAKPNIELEYGHFWKPELADKNSVIYCKKR